MRPSTSLKKLTPNSLELGLRLVWLNGTVKVEAAEVEDLLREVR
jgi:hypothetical protein